MPHMQLPQHEAQEPRRAANRRTALILLSIALVFFGEIIAKHYIGSTTLVVAGFAIIGLLLVALGRKAGK